MKKLIMTFLLLVGITYSQTNTFNNGNSTDVWSDAGNWSLGVVPTASHDVVIPADEYCWLDVNGSCKSLTVQPNGSIERKPGVNVRYLTVTDNIVCNGSIGNGTLNGAFGFNLNGNTVISGSGNFSALLLRKNAGDNTSTVTINRNITLLGTGNVLYNNFNGANSKFDVTISSGVTVSVPSGFVQIDGVTGTGGGGGTFNINGTLTISTGTLNLYTDGTGGQNCIFNINSNGVVNVPGCVTDASVNQTHQLVINADGKLNITSTNLGALSNTNNVYTVNANSIVEFSANANQTVNNLGSGYSNLYLTGSGVKTLTGVTVNGTLRLGGTATVSGTPTYGAGSTLEYAGTSAQVTTANEFSSVNNLTINNTNGVSINGDKTISGQLVINAGSTLNIGGYNFQSAGVVSNGTFSGSGKLILTGGVFNGTNSFPNVEIDGNVTKSSGSTTITGSLNLKSGTLTNSATLIYANGMQLLRENGTFSNTGTLTYSGVINLVYNSNVTTGAELPTSPTVLNNLTINGNVNLGSNVTVNGILTLNGTFGIGNNILTIKNPLQGTITNLTSTANSGLVISGNVSGIVIPTSITQLNSLVLDNTSGTVLNNDLTINSILTITNGLLNTADYTLYWNGTASNLTESAGKYVIGTMSVSKTVGSFASSDFGGIGVNLGAGADNLGLVTVKRIAGPGSAVNFDGKEGINRKWMITFANAYNSSNVRQITFSWVSSDDNGKTLSAMRVYRYNGTNWGDISLSNQNATSRSINVNLNENISGGTERTYTVSDAFSPLPVELKSFSAKVDQQLGAIKQNAVNLKWEVATEINNYGFEVERALNNGKSEKKNQEWIKIGFVKGFGNSNSPRTYSFIDQNPPSGKVLYRLKQIDNDGSFNYSDIIEINIDVPSTTELYQNFPNPFNPSTAIRFSLSKEAKVKITVYDILGTVVNELINETKPAGNHIVYWNSNDAQGNKVSSGIYFYKLETIDPVTGSVELSQIKKMNLIR